MAKKPAAKSPLAARQRKVPRSLSDATKKSPRPAVHKRILELKRQIFVAKEVQKRYVRVRVPLRPSPKDLAAKIKQGCDPRAVSRIIKRGPLVEIKSLERKLLPLEESLKLESRQGLTCPQISAKQPKKNKLATRSVQRIVGETKMKHWERSKGLRKSDRFNKSKRANHPSNFAYLENYENVTCSQGYG